jgi:CTP:molybdopterin cytidylyltransferase MocA
MARTAALVLAAGEGRRFGGPKAPFVLDGERLVDRAVRILRDAGCDPVVVVLGAWVGDVPDADVVVENEGWSEGMGSSLRTGLEALARDADDDVGAALVSLVDLVGLTSVAVARVLACEASPAAAAYDGRRGHPVRFARESWAEVAAHAHGDVGARDYLAAHAPVLVEVGDLASGDDLDLAPPG